MPKNGSIRTKIVVRKLPQSYTSDEFLKYVSPLEEHNYYNFVSGSLSGDPFSRAYFNFLNIEDTTLFKDRYDGYVFLDQKGEEFTALVEYAPYQKIPLLKPKTDLLAGTIESDGEYLRFVESLKKASERGQAPTDSLTKGAEGDQSMTPLVNFMLNKEGRKQKAKDEKKSRRSERPSKPPRSKPSKGSRKDRQREKFAEKKSKSATEAPSKTSKGTDSKTDRSTEDGKQIHVETLINNIKSADSRKENEEEKGGKGRNKGTFKGTKPSRHDDDTPREARTPDKGGATKAIKILTNPAKAEKEVGKQSNKRPPSRLVVASKGDAREGDFKGEVKSDTKQAADAKSTKDSKATGDSAKPVKQEAEENKQKKSRVRYKDRPERAIYKPGPKKKE